MTMKSGQCPKCGEQDIRSNTNRKFPALHTIALGAGSSVDRYAPLDTYICVSCGYVESYVARDEDLNHIKEEWAKVEASGDSESFLFHAERIYNSDPVISGSVEYP